MKRLRWILSLVVLLLLSVACDSIAEPYQHPATGLVFPDQISGMKKGKVTDYEVEHPGLGVAIGYNALGITVTIYLYTLGMKSLPSNLESQVFRKHFAQVVGEVIRAGEKGMYENVKKASEGEVFLKGTTQTGPKALSASFSYLQNGRERLSKLYLLGHKNHFLKVRFTYDRNAQAIAEQTHKQFQEDLATLIEGVPASHNKNIQTTAQ